MSDFGGTTPGKNTPGDESPDGPAKTGPAARQEQMMRDDIVQVREQGRSQGREDVVALIPRLRRYARALTNDADRADDLVQDCLARALDRWHLWDGVGELRAWLFTIMHNIHANDMRKLGRRPSTVDIESQNISVRADQFERLAARETIAQLAALPIEQRSALLLIGLEGLSYEETAKVQGVPVGTVMSRLSRARERMRRSESVPAIRIVK